MINIGLTGGNGFLGSHIAKELSKIDVEYEIFDRNKYDIFNPNSLKDFVKNKNVIIHAAALNLGEMVDVLKVNVLGTAGLLEAISLYNPNIKIIFTSSVQAYLDNHKYGLSKKIGEDLVKFYSKRNNLTGFILRITNLYGPGCKPFYNSALTTFIYQAIHKEDITVNGDGSQIRDYLYVSDATDAIIQCIKKQTKDIETLDICSGKKYSLNDIIFKLKKYAKDIKIRYNTDYISEKWNFALSCEKAKKHLGWEARTSFDEGLEKTVNYYRK